MIDRFKNWLGKNKKDSNIKLAPTLVGTNIDGFMKDTNDMLSFLLDENKIKIKLDEYLHEYKVTLEVRQSKYFVEDENIITVPFNKIKDDLIPYLEYASRKYVIDNDINIKNESGFLKSKSRTIEQLKTINNLHFTSINFYIRK